MDYLFELMDQFSNGDLLRQAADEIEQAHYIVIKNPSDFRPIQANGTTRYLYNIAVRKAVTAVVIATIMAKHDQEKRDEGLPEGDTKGEMSDEEHERYHQRLQQMAEDMQQAVVHLLSEISQFDSARLPERALPLHFIIMMMVEQLVMTYMTIGVKLSIDDAKYLCSSVSRYRIRASASWHLKQLGNQESDIDRKFDPDDLQQFLERDDPVPTDDPQAP